MPVSNQLYRIEKKVLDFIQLYSLINPGEKFLVALSGGPDSVFALHFLSRFAEQLSVTFAAAHVNHLLRGAESDTDAVFCSELCNKMNINFYVKEINIQGLKSVSKGSIEEIARKERYNFFEQLSVEHSFDKIITAHNKNDNAETVLLNLIKGTSARGLAGIPKVRGNIIRPMLAVTKKEILYYLSETGIEFRIDSSNKSHDFERNFIRHEVLPIIQTKLNPDVVEAINRTSGNIDLFSETISQNAENNFIKFIHENRSRFSIDLALFNTVPVYISAEVLKKLFVEKIETEFNSKIKDMITKLAESQTGKRINLADDWQAVREHNSIELIKTVEEDPTEFEFIAGGSVNTEDCKLMTELIDIRIYTRQGNKGCEFISADNLDDIFILRNWKSGDKFVPLGMSGHKKLSDYLTDLKVPTLQRKNVKVLLNNEKIVWVVGFGISDEFKVNVNTKRVCKLCRKKS